MRAFDTSHVVFRGGTSIRALCGREFQFESTVSRRIRGSAGRPDFFLGVTGPLTATAHRRVFGDTAKKAA